MISIPRDKQLHFFSGGWLGLSALFIPWFYALLIVILIASGKELLWDKLLKRGTPEVLDFVASSLGGLIVIRLITFFQ